MSHDMDPFDHDLEEQSNKIGLIKFKDRDEIGVRIKAVNIAFM